MNFFLAGTKFDSTLDANVFQEVAPEFRRLVNPKELAPQLKMRQILTPTEFEMMNNDVIERMDKNVKLLAVLPSKGLRALDVTYLSLWDSYESVLGDGLHGHYELAMLLWQSCESCMCMPLAKYNYKCRKYSRVKGLHCWPP